MDNVSFQRLLDEISEIRTRLNAIEQKILSEQPSRPSYTQSSVSKPAQQTHSKTLAPSVSFQNSTYVPSSTPSRFGTGGILGIVGILCFVLAASYLIQLAIDTGWLTPVRQITLSALFASTLIFAGYLLRAKDIPYMSMLPAAGVVILFLTSYASGFYYKLVDQPETLALIWATSIFSISLYFIFDQIYYVLVAAVGAYFCPLLVDRAVVDLTSFMIIFTVWNFTFAYLSTRLKRREVNLIASYLALLVFFQQTFIARPDESLALVAIFQLFQFLIFFGALIKHSIEENTPLNSAEAWSFFPMLFVFYELEYIIVDRIAPGLAPLLSLVFAGLIFGIYFLAKKTIEKKNLQSGPMVYAFCSIVLYQSLYWEHRSSIHSPWFCILILLGLSRMTKKINLFKEHIVGVIIAFLILFAEYWKIFSHSADSGTLEFYEYILLSFLVTGFLASYYLNSIKQSHRPNADWFILLLLGYVQAMNGLSKIGKEISTALSFTDGKFMVSILWILLAVGILMIGKIRKDAFFARTSLFVFAVSICKVFFYDLTNTGPIMRIVSLIGIGATLYFGGYLYRHIETWEKSSD